MVMQASTLGVSILTEVWNDLDWWLKKRHVSIKSQSHSQDLLLQPCQWWHFLSDLSGASISSYRLLHFSDGDDPVGPKPRPQRCEPANAGHFLLDHV